MNIFNQQKLKHYNLFADKSFYFLHIPKTAGTSFITHLEENLDNTKTFPFFVWTHLDNEFKNLNKFKYFRGHYGLAILRYLKQKPLIMTILRSPSERLLSMLSAIQFDKISNNWVFYNYLDGVADLFDVLFDNLKSKNLANTQTRYLGVDIDVVKIVKEKYSGFFNSFLYDSEVSFVIPEEPMNIVLTEAKKNLRSFNFLGITEYFPETLALFSYTFNLKPLINNKFFKERTDKKQIFEMDEKIIKRLYELNKYDIELYEYAKKEFLARYQLMVRELKNEFYKVEYSGLSEIEQVNCMLNKRYQQGIARNWQQV